MFDPATHVKTSSQIHTRATPPKKSREIPILANNFPVVSCPLEVESKIKAIEQDLRVLDGKKGIGRPCEWERL